MSKVLQLVISGVAVGGIYGLVALGLVLVDKSTHVFNFAHGEFVALSAFLLTTFSGLLGGDFDALVIALTLVAATLIGVITHIFIIRHMANRPLLATVMVTIGLGLALRATILVAYGPNPRRYDSAMPQGVLEIGGAFVAISDLITIGIAAVLLLAFAWFFVRSRLGLQMRAVASHMEAAALCGVRITWTSATALGIGGLLAGVSAVLLASTGTVSLNLTHLALVAFPAIVIGGITSVPGAVVGGVVVGILEKLAAGYIGPQASVAIVYTALLLTLLLRPQGLLGEEEVLRA